MPKEMWSINAIVERPDDHNEWELSVWETEEEAVAELLRLRAQRDQRLKDIENWKRKAEELGGYPNGRRPDGTPKPYKQFVRDVENFAEALRQATGHSGRPMEPPTAFAMHKFLVGVPSTDGFQRVEADQRSTIPVPPDPFFAERGWIDQYIPAGPEDQRQTRVEIAGIPFVNPAPAPAPQAARPIGVAQNADEDGLPPPAQTAAGRNFHIPRVEGGFREANAGEVQRFLDLRTVAQAVGVGRAPAIQAAPEGDDNTLS